MKVYNPLNIRELDNLISGNVEKFTYVAGSTDLMVNENRWSEAHNLVDISRTDELINTFSIDGNGILIGSAKPFSDIINQQIIREKFPLLVEACRQIGSVQIQNRATFGGNIANASPAGDTLPVLSVLDARIYLGPEEDGKFRIAKVEDVMIGPGQNSLQNNSYIAYIYIPFPDSENHRWYYRKVGQRFALAISKLSLALTAEMSDKKVNEIKICAGSVAPQVKRAYKTEEFLTGKELTNKIIDQSRELIINEIKPITDIRSNSKYRSKITGEVLREALHSLI
ncbi:MAG: FAD binding domain-containing protein [Melioribacteraceae bacterium]|nr:FAD binding domain-containing protein [Melioribacteraceae bacterium]MCF8394399.1 FAD binding domain-containing protein [Melioribacteraceae bacterium]MCF8417505.1 FAD binding domain-containing protein [Melioribacteraceae bacterium]